MGNICGCHNRVTDLDIKKNTIFTKKEFDITLYDPEILGQGISGNSYKLKINNKFKSPIKGFFFIELFINI